MAIMRPKPGGYPPGGDDLRSLPSVALECGGCAA